MTALLLTLALLTPARADDLSLRVGDSLCLLLPLSASWTLR